MAHRDIVVIGGSTGGLSALQQMAAGLPVGLPVSLFVVVHTSPDSPGHLPELLSKAGPLPASYATDCEAIKPGRIYVAPPDRHLLLEDGSMMLTLGPRENGFRPAIDPLFRTAANNFGRRVIGIVVSGGLNDGTHGLQIIKRRGGIAVAQRIEEAIVPHMPLSAIRNVELDHIVGAADMAPLIVDLSRRRLRGRDVNGQRRVGRDVAERGTRKLEHSGPDGVLSPFTCPECGGALWQQQDGKLDLFRCHVGHGFTTETLANGLDDRLEQAMWTALRTLEETVALQRRLAAQTRARGLLALARGHETRAHEAQRRATAIQQVLTREDSRTARTPARQQRSRKGQASN